MLLSDLVNRFRGRSLDLLLTVEISSLTEEGKPEGNLESSFFVSIARCVRVLCVRFPVLNVVFTVTLMMSSDSKAV